MTHWIVVMSQVYMLNTNKHIPGRALYYISHNNMNMLNLKFTDVESIVGVRMLQPCK